MCFRKKTAYGKAIRPTIRGIVQLHEKDQRKTMTTVEKQKALMPESQFDESVCAIEKHGKNRNT
jgi:hypothetical protein